MRKCEEWEGWFCQIHMELCNTYVCEDARVCECVRNSHFVQMRTGLRGNRKEVQKQAAPHSLNQTPQTGSCHDDDGSYGPRDLANASAVLIAMTSAVLIDLMLTLLTPFMPSH